MKEIVSLIQEHLSDSDVDLALKKLRSIFSMSDSDLVNDAIILMAELKRLNSKIRKGIIDHKEENLMHNRIMDSVLSLVDEINEEPEKYKALEKAENKLAETIQIRGSENISPKVKDALFDRITFVKEKGTSMKVLWVCDQPSSNDNESKILQSIGLEIDFVKSSDEALLELIDGKHELLLSDIARNGNNAEGLRFHQELVSIGIDLPTVFYVGYVNRERGVPPFAFGITAQPNDLIHLVLDVVERK